MSSNLTVPATVVLTDDLPTLNAMSQIGNNLYKSAYLIFERPLGKFAPSSSLGLRNPYEGTDPGDSDLKAVNTSVKLFIRSLVARVQGLVSLCAISATLASA